MKNQASRNALAALHFQGLGEFPLDVISRRIADRHEPSVEWPLKPTSEHMSHQDQQKSIGTIRFIIMDSQVLNIGS